MVCVLLGLSLCFATIVLSPQPVTAQQTTWKVGDRIEVQWQGDWYKAEVIEVKGTQYKIHYVGYAASWDEWIDKSRIRTSSTKPNNENASGNAGAAFTQVLTLLSQARAKQVAGRFDEAIVLAEQALDSSQKDLGAEHAAVVMSLALLAQLHDQKHDYDKAEGFYLRALAIANKPNNLLQPDFAATLLNGLGRVYETKGDLLRAEPLYQRALALQEKTLGPQNPMVATTLTNLGGLYQTKGEYGQAEKLLKRALAIREKITEPADEIYYIQSLKSLASLYEMKGEYAKGGALLEQVVTRLAKLFGAESPIITGALNDLALHYKIQGDYIKAEQLYLRAIAIVEKAAGPDAPALANTLDNLGILYQAKGDYPKAESLYKRALALKQKSLRPDDPDLGTTMSNLAVLYEDQHNYELAEPLLQQALAIKEKALGPTHSEVATLLSNLTVLYYDKGDYEKAELISQRVLTIKEKALGPAHPDVAIALNNLGALKEKKGDYKSAETLYLRALAIYEKKFGPKHPETTNMIFNLGLLAAARGNTSQAMSYLARGTDISEYNAALILTTGSEDQKRRYLGTLSSETDYVVSLHLRSLVNDASAARLALTTILRRKGRALDAMTEQLAALRRRSDPQDRALLDQLETARAKLSALVLRGAGGETSEAEQRAAIAKLEAEAQQLEAAVSARSAEFRAQSQPVTIESVQAALPAGSALVEIASYLPFNANAKSRAERYGAARYAAYVLGNTGQPRWVDLGDAAAINADVSALRKVLISPRSTNVKQAGQSLFAKVMQPVLQLIGNTHRLFLSPDGDLNLIPFGALVDEHGKYLIENYAITYLTSGRDLLRLQVPARSKQGPVVFANPLFNQASNTTQTGDVPDSGRRSGDLRNARFKPLPGTAGEATALASVLSGVKVWTGEQATEAALKQVSGPSILHIATHGFFLPDQRPAAVDPAGGRGLGLGSSGLTENTTGENPLLRSGLALAGVNQHQSGVGEDGVLTALEAAGLDLWGTKLVVLSACETGLGDVKNGEGVYGLRRALVLAGSESQVMSLWQVSDAATRDLMSAYYRRLQAGEGRSEALRQVQLAMIHNAAQGSATDYSHPFYWASFIQSGDWRSLDGSDQPR
jgi:CHAT domain-containing protein/Tfp pilus assembly protein PilF